MKKKIKLEDIEKIFCCKNEVSPMRATSGEKSIKFYFNETQYVEAFCEKGKIKCELIEEIEEKKSNDKLDFLEFFINSLPKKDKRDIKSFIFMILISYYTILYYTKNAVLICLLLALAFWILLIIMECIVYEKMIHSDKSSEINSKHSGEHKMINFMKKKKRLPNSIKEIKKSSRFSIHCGTNEEYKDILKIVITFAIILVIGGIIFLILSNLFHGILFIVIYAILTYKLFFVYYRKIYNTQIVDVISDMLKIVDGHFLQYFNTSRKVKDEDLEIAFLSGKVWFVLTYPELCTEEQINEIKNMFI